MRLELTESVDLSRDGLLIHRQKPCELHSRVWIVWPFEPEAAGSVVPETPGRIARVVPDHAGGYWVGVRLEHPVQRPAEQERRRAERVPLALPIFLRLAGTPWPEESMTHDLSPRGVRFETPHLYLVGQEVIAQIPWGDWSTKGQIHGRVVRVESLNKPSGASSANDVGKAVAIEWLDRSQAGGSAKS